MQYSIGNNFQSSNTFSGLATGNFTVNVIDNNGCTSDTTVFVSEIKPANALFTANLQAGTEPLFVDFTNQSTHANNFIWLVGNNPFSGSYHTSYSFDSSGVYTITLIAFNNLPHCADTFSVQIIVYDSLMAQIPNVFTPNNDGINDNFSILVEGAKEVKCTLINRWGNSIFTYGQKITTSPSTVHLWDGHTTSGEKVTDGVYYYMIELTDMEDKIKSVHGFVHVFK